MSARRFLLFVSLSASVVTAAEIHSNGHGGGPWSEASSWHGNVVPTANDVATIAGEDNVVMDLKDDQKTSCKELYIDPKGALSFKQGAGKVVLIVNGPVESYGLIRLDMKDSAEGSGELRLVGETPDQRIIRLQRGGSLILYGRPGLPGNQKNATISARLGPNEPPGQINAGDNSALDINNAALTNLVVYGVGLDNTGATPNERVNIVSSRFTGMTRIQLDQCDTPLIADNEITTDRHQQDFAGILLAGGALGTVRNNKVSGDFTFGILLGSYTDAAIIGNTVTGAYHGFYSQGSSAMFQQNSARNCQIGLLANNAVVSDFTVENCGTGVSINSGILQLTDGKITAVVTNAVPILLNLAQATLLNCPFTPNQIKTSGEPRREANGPPLWWAEARQYVIVRVHGQVPAQAQVVIVTANPEKPLPPGALDLNVQNSPAMIGPGGWTPFPQSLNPLIVRTWRIEADGKVTPAPLYKLRVLGPAPKPDAPQPILKEVDLTPLDSWYRPNPNEQKATVEVTLP